MKYTSVCETYVGIGFVGYNFSLSISPGECFKTNHCVVISLKPGTIEVN